MCYVSVVVLFVQSIFYGIESFVNGENDGICVKVAAA